MAKRVVKLIKNINKDKDLAQIDLSVLIKLNQISKVRTRFVTVLCVRQI